MRLDYSAVTQRLQQLGALDPLAAIIDSSDLRQALPQALNAASLGAMTEGWLGQLTPAQLQSLTQQFGGQVLQASELSASLTGTQGHDFLHGHAGSDQLQAGQGHDFLSGGEGDDALYAGEGNDLLLGGGGSDYLIGETGNDMLEGGTDNDNLSGDAGSDVYRFSRGCGQDSIYDYDTAFGNIDAIEFAAGIAPGDIIISRSEFRVHVNRGLSPN